MSVRPHTSLPARAATLQGPRRWLSALAVLALLGAANLPAPAEARAAPESFADLAARLLPAVVNISTTRVVRDTRRGPEIPQFPPGSPFEEFFRDFFDRAPGDRPQQQRRASSLGSGFIIDPSGVVVTNYHVIEGADEITVTLADDSTLKAEVVGRDPRTDVAVLRVESDRQLPFVRIGDSDSVRVGDWVIAIGNPFGLGGTVTAGIVSARQRDINQGPYDDFIQTDASINRGNSGGPMFNMDGEVIGINTAIYSPSGGSVGIGFAIPSSLASPIINQLRDDGRVRRGWLGVRIQTVTEEIAESLNLDRAAGALVASVTNGGPAEQAGIQPGDVIVSFAGRDVTEMRRLPRIVAETTVETEVDAVVWRRGERVTVRVTVGEMAEEDDQLALMTPAPDAPSVTIEAMGFSLSSISSDLREEYGLSDDVHGVVVTDVRPGSAAAERGVQPGDVIIEVGQEEVTAPGQVESRVREAREEGRRTVLLLIDRHGDLQFVALRIDQG